MELKLTYPRTSAAFRTHGRFWNLLWTLITSVILVSVIIFLNFKFNDALRAKSSPAIYYSWLVIEGLACLTYLGLMIVSQLSTTYAWSSWKEKLFYAVIGLNPFRFFFVLNYAYKHHFLHFRLQKWKTFDYLIIALSYAVYLILAFFCKQLLPVIPVVFLSFSFEYLALFFVAYLTNSFTKTCLTGLLCGASLLFFPSIYFINFLQFTFDYLIPNLCVSFAALVCFDQPQFKKSKFFTFFTLPYLGIYLSRVLAGVIFYRTFAYPGFPLLLFSLIINGINTFFDYGCLFFTGIVIFPRLASLHRRYQWRIKVGN